MTSFFLFAWQHLPNLLYATETTLLLWIVSVSMGFFLGWLLTMGRAYGNRFWQLLTTAYIELFRGTPMLVQIFIIYMGLPTVGITLSAFWSVICAMTLNTAAYQAEYFRGAIGAVRVGQVAAARTIGMSQKQALLHVVFPQAMRIALPQWTNEVILELKYTSIAFAIGVQELMGQAKLIGSHTFHYFQIFAVAACIYVVIVSLVTVVLSEFEKHYALRQ